MKEIEITCYAYNTPYISAQNTDKLAPQKTLCKWFADNRLKTSAIF